MRVRLPQQPIQVLCVLLENSGEIVTREELHKLLWPADVFVDFDLGLNKSVQKLREALGDSAESPRFIETIPRIGYRFIAPVVGETATVNLAPLEEVAPATAVEAPDQLRSVRRIRSKWKWYVLGACTAIIFVIAVWVIEGQRQMSVGSFVRAPWQRTQGGPIRSVAVLRLRSRSPEPNVEYFAEGMTEELISELAAIPELRVISDTSTSASPTNEMNDPPSEVGRRLGADALVEGSVVRSDDMIRLEIRLVDVRSGRQLWTEQFEDPTKDVLSLQRHIASEIVAHAQVLLTPSQRTRLNRTQPLDPAAYDGYLQGRYLLNKRDAEGAVLLFRRAVVLDPGYARAWAGLAAGLADAAMGSSDPLNGPISEAKAAAKHAIELDPENGEAWSVLGQIAFNSEWDWKTAEYDLQRAIALSPSDAVTELRYATYLSIVGRHDEAVSHMRRALELDPLSFFNVRHMGSVLFWSRRYDESLQYLRRAQEMEPDLIGFTADWISKDYEMKGMRDESVMVEIQSAPSVDPTHWRDRLDSAYRNGGPDAYWKACIKMMLSFPQTPCSGFELANAYARIGEKDDAIKSLRRALKERCFAITTLNADPLFDRFRNDPGFRDLQKELNLAE